MILLLPMDVGDRDDDVLNMHIWWQVFFIIVAVLVIVVNPFFIFYYENDDDNNSKQWAAAVKWTAVTTFIALVIILVMYFLLNDAEIPVAQLSSPGFSGPDASGWCTGQTNGDCKHRKDELLVIPVSFPIYLIGLVSALGWFFFVMFGGVGLISLPIDMCLAFYYRPRPIDIQEFARKKIELSERARSLLAIGEELKKEQRTKSRAKFRKVYNKFRAAVFLLELEFEKTRVAFHEHGGSPLKYGAIAVGAFFSIILSLLWFIHIIIYVVIQPAAHPFLNDLFKSSESNFALFGTVLYAIFASYLLFCVIKGCIKLGLRLFIFFPIHPMRVGKTLMNSFLFNVSLILLCSVAVVQFCVTAFSVYARRTAAVQIFGTQIRYLKGLKYLYQYYVYALLGMMGLSLIYFLIRPQDKANQHELEVDVDEIMAGRGGQKKMKKDRWYSKAEVKK